VEAVKRKRVTQVGSGAWSIYLPKKWIDSWSPEQQAGREVDLHLINRSLLIVPVLQDRAFEAEVSCQADELRTVLLSAYVRGAVAVRLRPDGGRFDSDCIAAARDFLRHLDERLVATVGPDAIGFHVPEAGPGTGAALDLMALMAAKVREVVGLAADCVEHSGTDPDRALHAARLLQAIHEEDLSRLFHQTLRRVATLELSLESVTDFQLLDLAATHLHAMGAQAVRVAATILDGYGLKPEDLAYPRGDLVRRLGRRPSLPPVAREIVQGYRKPFAAAQALVTGLPPALAAGDVAALRMLGAEAVAARAELQEALFSAVVRHWGDEASREGAALGFIAYQVGHPLANLLGSMASLSEHAITLTAAKPASGSGSGPAPASAPAGGPRAKGGPR
jgi:phosphate uptake regulator